MIKPVIICIAKHETDYIEEFVLYHLHLGFDKIFIYDNEDTPTYAEQLKHFGSAVIVEHLPGKNYPLLPQYEAIQRFTWNHSHSPDITHVAHIDLDEFIVLKKHANIKDFIKEYIWDGENGVMCGGIGINWKMYGSSGKTVQTNEPLTVRFTKCQTGCHQLIKTLYNKQFYGHQSNPHNINTNNGNFPMKTTDGRENTTPNIEMGDVSIIQINHYKSKTWEEFQYTRSRGRADRHDHPEMDDLKKIFDENDLNDEEEFYAHTFYSNLIQSPELVNKYIIKDLSPV